jgi:hypothetical protein
MPILHRSIKLGERCAAVVYDHIGSGTGFADGLRALWIDGV